MTKNLKSVNIFLNYILPCMRGGPFPTSLTLPPTSLPNFPTPFLPGPPLSTASCIITENMVVNYTCENDDVRTMYMYLHVYMKIMATFYSNKHDNKYV